MIRKILKPEFFNRDTKIVAQELLGKFLVRNMDAREVALMITETETYDGPHDKASHASKGRTKRTEIMFGEAGRLCVYLCCGMHFMLNVVTREPKYPAAILIRGVEGIDGPGKVTKYFSIDKDLNGKRAHKKNGIWFEDRFVSPNFASEDRGVTPNSKFKIQKLPRVGVSYAGKYWSSKKLRFRLM